MCSNKSFTAILIRSYALILSYSFSFLGAVGGHIEIT